MNDVILMNNFISQFANFAANTNDYSASEYENTIYYYFVRQGTNISDQNVKLDEYGMFDRFQRYFSGKQNCKCFVDENWSYFCQFVNDVEAVRNCKEHIKIYIPLDYEHIEVGAEAIFDFLERNNIKHASKIGKHIRFDDIVVRLTNEQDANKLQRFIDSNSYVQEGLIKSNPFACDKNGIAYACDGHLSYNNTVASALSVYLEDMKKNNELDKAGIESFAMYCAHRFKNDSDLFIKDLNGKEINNEKMRKNYKQVCELFIDSMLTKLMNYYQNCANNNPDYCEAYIDRLNYVSQQFGTVFTLQADPIKQFYKNSRDELNIDKKQFIDKALSERYNKYETEYNYGQSIYSGEDAVFNVIERFIKTENYNLFTRQNNIRQNMIDNVSKNDMLEIICKTLNIDIPIERLTDEQIKFISMEYSKLIKSHQELKQATY